MTERLTVSLQEILTPIDDGMVNDFDIIQFLRYLGQINGITFWVTLGRGIQELESPHPYRIHMQSGNAGYATYMLVDERGKVALGGHGHLQVSSVDKISFEILPSCTCLPATYNIFFEDIALRSALLNISFPVWWNPGKPAFYAYYPEAYDIFMQLVQHFGSMLMKVDGKWVSNSTHLPSLTRMHHLAQQRFEKIYTKINYANQSRKQSVEDVPREYQQYVAAHSSSIKT